MRSRHYLADELTAMTGVIKPNEMRMAQGMPTVKITELALRIRIGSQRRSNRLSGNVAPYGSNDDHQCADA